MAKVVDEDLDALIDQAVDTFFVEAPTEEEAFGGVSPGGARLDEKPKAASPKNAPPPGYGGPSLDEAVDSLFVSSFDETPERPSTSVITSGDDETDREIDLAVETLFVEEPDSPPPETAQLEVGETELPDDEDFLRNVEAHAQRKQSTASRAVPAKPDRSESQTAEPSYDDIMAQEIQRHMQSILNDTLPEPAPAPNPIERPAPKPVPKPAPKPAQRPALKPAPKPAATSQVTRTIKQQPAKTAHVSHPPVIAPEPHAVRASSPVRKLQEAILTLEWEISRRSVTVLAGEIEKMRLNYQDDVTVDFAALSMRIVLEYVVKRMSRAHPESIRFLLEVSDYLDTRLAESDEDPLESFHFILMRYEQYKSIVRKAEGLPDNSAAILNQLQIKDPAAFYKMVDQQARTISRAGRSLASRMNRAEDPENLIRSFRFLVNRSVNRILENTHKGKVKKVVKKK